MYQDSGLFLRGESGLGFATRRMERRMDQGIAAPRAWRSHTGAVLRLLPDRLAALAAEVKAAAHPAHPAAADPEGAVRERVAGLVRAARPAGTVADRASGRTLHLFRAPGRTGEMEIVTLPNRGVLFDIVEVRPAAMQGELEVYQDRSQGYRAWGRRVRGPRAALHWHAVPLLFFLRNLHNPGALGNLPNVNVIYVVVRQSPGMVDPVTPGLPLYIPRYVGESLNLRGRWTPNHTRYEALAEPGDALMVADVAPDPTLTFHYNAATAQRLANQPQLVLPTNQRLLRRDIEHVLIRVLNAAIDFYNNAHQTAFDPLTNESSHGGAVSDPNVGGNVPGVDLAHVSAQNAVLPWFFQVPFNIASGTQFEISGNAALDGAAA